MNFKLIRHAKVKVIPVANEKGVSLQLDINGEFQHTFSPRSKESALFATYDIPTIEAMFNGGTYFFIEGKLVNYRRGDYRGFIHSDEAIARLAEVVGARNSQHAHSRRSVNGLLNAYRGNESGFILGGPGDDFELGVAKLRESGQFRNQLWHSWSPFSHTIQTTLLTERLVCANGLISTAPVVTFEVPLVSDWENNLRIASQQMIPRVNAIMRQRLERMAETRASVDDLLKASAMLMERANSQLSDEEAVKRLEALARHMDPEVHLSAFYEPHVFQVGSKAAQLNEGHMTQFDVFNILTEAVSHSDGPSNNTIACNRLSSNLMFERGNRERNLSSAVPPVSQDSDHRRAFYGK